MDAPRILIIEDEYNLARTLTLALRQALRGATITVCHSGNEAASAIVSSRFDLVISDQRLPDVSGLNLLVRLKQLYPETRMIMMTAYGSEEVESKARAVTDAFLAKPFDLPEMIATVKRILQNGQPYDRDTASKNDPELIIFERESVSPGRQDSASRESAG